MKSWKYLWLSTLFVGCGNNTSLTSSPQDVELIVYGTYAEPATATGNAAPIFYELSLENLILVPTEGDDVNFSPKSTETLRVIDRPQRVFKDDIKNYEGNSFRQVQIYFNESVTVGGKYRDDYALTLADPMILKDGEFKIKKGKGLKVEIKIEWQNTIARDKDTGTEEIQQPHFNVTIDN